MIDSSEFPQAVFLASTLVTGGAERVVEALARRLPEAGVGTRVFCINDPGPVGEALRAGGTPLEARLAAFHRDPLAPARLAFRLRPLRRAVLVAVDHHDAVFLGAACGAAAGLGRRVLMVHSTGLWGKRSSFSASDRLSLPAYGSVVALSRMHAEYLERSERIPARKIRIVPNGVDIERFRPAASAGERAEARSALGVPPDSFAAVMVAALRPEKNHPMLLAAASIVAAAVESFTLLVVGEGPEGPALRALCRERALEKTVRFLGARDDVPRILAAADCSVLSSHPVVETFPLVVLESMAAGTAVVATAVGSIPEMIRDGVEGLIVPPGAADELARAIISIARDPERRRALAARARDRAAREYTIDRMVAGYASLVRELAGS